MDKTRAEGAAQNVGGKIKEAVGKTVGDSKLTAEGKTDQVVGSVKNAIGGAKDAAREAANRPVN